MSSHLLAQSTKRKIAAAVVTVPILFALASYLFLVAAERYSAWQASRILDRVESLRLGDAASSFESAVQGCETKKAGAIYDCNMVAGAFRFQVPWRLVSKLPGELGHDVEALAGQAAVRPWTLGVSCSVSGGRIDSISAHLWVAGRYETLGAEWSLAEKLPSHLQGLARTADQQGTYLGYFHITSPGEVGGEGFGIHATVRSTEKELRARRINRRCLFTSRGCDGLCEILPEAIPVLRERGSGWGGSTGVPQSRCDWK